MQHMMIDADDMEQIPCSIPGAARYVVSTLGEEVHVLTIHPDGSKTVETFTPVGELN